jgi:hypothetical protein
MYQSLHTTVIGPYGERIEIQIRTHEMHKIAEEGIAAHWKYKEGKVVEEADDKRFTWLRQLLEWQRDLKDDAEFIGKGGSSWSARITSECHMAWRITGSPTSTWCTGTFIPLTCTRRRSGGAKDDWRISVHSSSALAITRAVRRRINSS